MKRRENRGVTVVAMATLLLASGAIWAAQYRYNTDIAEVHRSCDVERRGWAFTNDHLQRTLGVERVTSLALEARAMKAEFELRKRSQ
jgi:hypothetical protein